ncbi:MAG: diacylglycerol kinase family protein [Anaerolineales bacterium]|nr:diacylglycerol kinase family protein [Anaerolineales bacterium]
MIDFLRERLASFGPAFSGMAHVLRTQPNAWVHAAVTIAVAALGWVLGLGIRDWALLVLAIGLVWVAEFVNTALEALVDLASPRRHPLARAAKDAAAAAVVLAALTATLLGLLVLGPPLWLALTQLGDSLLR